MRKILLLPLILLATEMLSIKEVKAQNPTFNNITIDVDSFCHKSSSNFGFLLRGNTLNAVGLHKVIITNSINSTEFFRDTFDVNQNFIWANVIEFDTGYNTVKLELWDASYTSLFDSTFVYKNILNKSCNSLHVYNFLDEDNNCARVYTEPILPGINMGIFKNNVLLQTYISNYGSKNLYAYDYYETDTIKLKLLNNTYSSCYTNDEFDFQFDTVGIYEIFNFGIQCVTGEDLYLSATNTYRTAAGPSYIYLTYGNISCDSAFDVEIEYTFPTQYDFVSSNNTNNTIAGNTITFDIGDIPGSFQGQFWVKLQNTDTTMMVGDSVYQSGVITPITNDINPANNQFGDSVAIIGSYDPNQKTTLPEEYLDDPLQSIEYLIEFENLGNDTAFLVRLADTLSDLLDYNTFEILGASHEYQFSLDDYSSTSKILTITFQDINLADSSNQDENKGFFKYRIAPKPGLTLGTKIHNTAHIYFDYNPAIVTNTTSNELRPLGINTPNNNLKVAVYPNPVNNVMVVDNVEGKVASVNIYNVLGQKIHTQNIAKGKTEINTASFANGVYMLECKGQNGVTKTIKFVKE